MTRARPNPVLALGPLSLLASFCLFWFSDTVADPDLWGHIRFGQDILRTSSIIQTDTHSYRTAGQAWINHEWLAEVIFAGIYDRLGPQGLIGSKVFVSLLIIGLCYAHVRRQSLGPVRSMLLLVLASIPFRMGLGTVRPQVFTCLLFLFQLFLLQHASTTGHTAWLWLSPVLFAVWVNLHGGVLAGIGVLGLWIAVRIVTADYAGMVSVLRGQARAGPSTPPGPPLARGGKERGELPSAAGGRERGELPSPRGGKERGELPSFFPPLLRGGQGGFFREGRGLGAIVHEVLPGIASGLALLLNPYGAGLVGFLLRTATVPRPEIGEWTPLGLISLPGLLYLVLLTIGILGLIGSRRHRRPEAVAILGLTAVLPMLANRHYPLFALTLIVLGGEHIADASNRWWPPAGLRPHHRRMLATFSLIASLLMIGLSLPRFGCIRVEPFYFPFPARAVAFLKQGGVRGNMAVPFDWGEYVLWHLGPGVKVSMDGRRETVYSDESYRQSRDFERGTGVWDALLKTGPPTDLILTPNGSPTAVLVGRTGGWLALYQDAFCLVFVRASLPSLDQLLANPVPALPDNGGGLCFPAPDSRFRNPNVRQGPGR